MSSYINFSLEGKVALVTGAAYGIGFAMAEALAMAGAKIAFNCRGKEHLCTFHQKSTFHLLRHTV